MGEHGLGKRVTGVILLILFVVACAVVPRHGFSPADTPTPDPCTGWWCTATGIVYADAAGSGNELEGASVRLYQTSNCSPTRGQTQTTTGPDGAFEFSEVFLHDTDRIRIQVESESYEPSLWESAGFDCLYCSCFGSAIEIVLRAASGQ